MSKFDLGGQVAGLSRKDAISAQASNAITDSGYLGGKSWIKAQLDAQKALCRGDGTGIDGYEEVSFNSAKEGMLIPDGQFDFFDLTYDLNLKNVQEALVVFQAGIIGVIPQHLPKGSECSISSAVPSFGGFNGDIGGAISPVDNKVHTLGNVSFGNGSAGMAFIVNSDYRDCTIAGTIKGAGDTSGATNLGYKISGNNPPTDDTGRIYGLPGFEDYRSAFPKYSDATDASSGLRYMIGIYGGDACAIADNANDKYVVKSMAIKILKSGQCQLVLHCRKAAATTGVTINSDGACRAISVLKLNY